VNRRIKKLRGQSLRAKPRISPERAKLITEFWRSDSASRVSSPVRRALAFKYLLDRKKICINRGELIVGERGPSPMATPTYPEITAHSLKDLTTLNDRKKVPFAVDDKTRKLYRDETITFWKGRSIRDRIFEKMSPQWKDAYEAGIFTEFMEQRAPGHTVLDDKIYRKGFLDFIKDIQESIKKLNFLDDPRAYQKREELEAMKICAEALIHYALRHADRAQQLAGKEKNPQRKKELKKIAGICSRVPAYAPKNFWEALQYYWFVHLGVIIEYNTWDAFNPGRLDQHLYPFYKKDLERGTLTRDQAKELLQALRIPWPLSNIMSSTKRSSL
jgi:formate C-acetyltransferase